eukprot:gene52300-32413_t
MSPFPVSPAGPGLARWEVVKARKGKGNWAEGGEGPPGDPSPQTQFTFYARRLDPSQPPLHAEPGRSGGSIYVRFRHAQVGGLFKKDPDPATSKRHVAPRPIEWQQDDDAEGMPRPYLPRNCWEELYHALLSARKFIYIAGWSVWHELRLLRERPVELLKRKAGHTPPWCVWCVEADEGVRVCIILWHELTSSLSLLPCGGAGFAGTFSQQTCDYFAGSRVQCRQFLRRATHSSGRTAVCFTHHQKFIVMDAPVLGGGDQRRRVIGFMGGLDEDEGPRQPWQDIHSKVEGPFVRDIVNNFEARWRTQCTAESMDHLMQTVSQSGRAGQLIGDPADGYTEEYVISPDHPESWNVQLLRSIDSNSDSMCLKEGQNCQDWGSWGSQIEKDIEKAGQGEGRKPQNLVPMVLTARICKAI